MDHGTERRVENISIALTSPCGKKDEDDMPPPEAVERQRKHNKTDNHPVHHGRDKGFDFAAMHPRFIRGTGREESPP